MDVARRDLLTLSGSALAGTVLAPSALRAQTPKRGGVLTLRVWDPYSAVLPAVWDPALKNYAPNRGYDYGGRLMAAWFDR